MCELGTGCLWLSVATRTLRPDKRPTSYGNSNSVQVFSASTFAAQRAVDWPGDQPGPQRRLSELQSVKTPAFIFEPSPVQKHTSPRLSVSR